MRSETRLESAVFQLTPTRTRCELVLIANGRTEKIASGLLNPFLAHLKSAQDQISKGGYSLKLEPAPEADAVWFTKGTLERFVRFVSTPEILERVTTIESEIVQIDDAISIQSNDELGMRMVDEPPGMRPETNDTNKMSYDADAEKALVIYKPGPQPPALNDTMPEENSKVQLLRVLESRKTVLRKEQAMAFARATAAGFDMDNMVCLISFAKCFGASRLMKACSQFMDLWKRKHETGQWIEVEAEAMSVRSEFPPYNASGIVFAGDNMGQNADTLLVSNGDSNTVTKKTDEKTLPNGKLPGHLGYFPGPYAQGAYPPWAMHPPPGSPMYQASQMHGMPYYPNYPGVTPYHHPPYPPTDDTRYQSSGRKPRRRHSMDSKDNAVSETYDDGTDDSTSELEKEDSCDRKSQKRGDRLGKKKPGVVVIRNLNYVASSKYDSSESESESASDETEEETKKSHSKHGRKHRDSSGSSKKKDGHKDAVASLDAHSKDEVSNIQDADQGNWQTFQSLLLRAEEKARTNDGDLFFGEKEPRAKKKENRGAAADLTVLPHRDAERDAESYVDDRFAAGIESRNVRRMVKHIESNDEVLIYREGRGDSESYLKEIDGRYGTYRRSAGDEFIIGKQDNQVIRGSLGPLAGNEFEYTPNIEKKVHTVTDDSFMIPVRSGADDNHAPVNRVAIDIDIEIPSTVPRELEGLSRLSIQPSYEPDELEMMPERVTEAHSYGYDPAMEYENQILIDSIKLKESPQVEVVPVVSCEEPKEVNKDKKLKNSQNGLDKRKKDTFVRRLSSSRATPVNDAKKRADALRSYKADLQKLKKEQEEEQIKRLERLKEERQQRIATRSGSSSRTQAPATPEKVRSARTTSLGSDPLKATRTGKLYGTANTISKSVSALP